MTRFFLFGLTALVVGCAVAPIPTAGPSNPPKTTLSPTPSPESTPPPFPPSPVASARSTMSGWWAYGFDPEPEPTNGPYFGCRQTLWLSQTGDTLAMGNNAVCGLPSEEAEGSRDGDRLHLDGNSYRGNIRTPLAIALKYDPMNDHLRGTWNGRNVWLVPGSPCPSVASLCSVGLEGALYDATGELVTSPSQVQIVATNPSYGVNGSIDVVGGRYAYHSLPFGTELVVTATAPGHEPVTRRVTIERGPSWILNFGGPATEADPEAPAFALREATNVTQGL